jgi:uncharacterized protein YqeY
MHSGSEIRERLRASLAAAIKARDAVAASALRYVLSAIANAEAVSPDGGAKLPRLGAGAADVPRRELSSANRLAVIRAEVGERTAAAEQLRRLGRIGEADRLQAEAAVLMSYAGGAD